MNFVRITVVSFMCIMKIIMVVDVSMIFKSFFFSGSPVIRPLWWIDPIDSIALVIDTEFMVGNDLLVAPVVFPGVTKIDIYLPKGQWKDDLKGMVLEGKRWLRDYEVTLEQIPTFSKHRVLE